MADYNAQLIDLLNEKISFWQKKWNEERKEKERLKKRIKELEKEVKPLEK